MTIPTFPAELPVPLIPGYGRQRADPRRRRSFDAGPPKFSRRYSAVAVTHSLSMRLHAWQVAIFERFYAETCAEGSLPFYMKDFTIDGLPLLDELGVPLLDSEGVPLLCSKIMLCTWGETPPAWGDPKITRQRVTFSVVEMP
ncbi:hypothetical protein [Salipiger thiooxidans]|uniref:hypothetical protein n=1 Tax=Salipiger thiooxidans TaxID=282683 RepID=UPI001CD78ADC|nr:hypothetical protein [Salipiger thiooxidans]MCA0851301.1 hypothetical protein [Salipiger thiooxidans]